MKSFLILLMSMVILGCAAKAIEREPATREWPESLVQATKILMKMEMKQTCTSFQENGIPLLNCEYWTGKPDRKFGRVILFDVSQEQWMSWIYNACNAIGKANSKCYNQVANQIFTQSGGQIAWRGIVYENLRGGDSLNEMYCFRNGISVAMKGLERWMTRQPTSDDIKKCFEEPDSSLYFVGKFPRPISLNVNDYQRLTGEKGLADKNGEGTVAWLVRIGEILPVGMGASNLKFIDMWTKLNVK